MGVKRKLKKQPNLPEANEERGASLAIIKWQMEEKNIMRGGGGGDGSGGLLVRRAKNG
jgi:hypothetical protein